MPKTKRNAQMTAAGIRVDRIEELLSRAVGLTAVLDPILQSAEPGDSLGLVRGGWLVHDELKRIGDEARDNGLEV